MKIEVTINNWEKYNPRKDVKETHWFRLNNNFLENPDFFGFSAQEKLTWIYLLSLASRKQSGAILLNLEHAERVSDLPRESVLSALEKLKEIDCIGVDVTWTLQARDVDVTPQTNRQTNKQTHVQINTSTETVAPTNAKPKRVKETPEALRSRENIRQAWIEFYKARYSFEPTDTRSVVFRTQLKRIHATLGEEKAIQAIKAYLGWDDAFIAKQAHPIGLLLRNLDALRADYVNPKAKYSAIARGRAQERVMTESEQRLEEMKAHVAKNTASNSTHLLAGAGAHSAALGDSAGDKSGGRVIPLSTQVRVSDQCSDVHVNNPQADFEAM